MFSKHRSNSARTFPRELDLVSVPSRETWSENDPLWQLAAVSIHEHPNRSCRPISAHNALVDRMVQLIHITYDKAVTLPALAASIGRQPAYLGNLFHCELGVTVREYVTRLRLKHASQLIREGVKIEAVALLVGYRSKKNFYWRFKQSFGTTPGQHRCQGGPGRSARTRHGDPATESKSTAPDAPVRRAFRDERFAPVTDSAAVPCIAARPLGEVGLRACHQALALAVRIQRVLLREFHDSRLAIMLTDEKGRYVGANSSAISLTGYSRPELRDLTPRDILSNPSESHTQCVWQIVLSEQRRPVNALLHPKTRESLRVHLVTLKNVLWGRSEMSALLEGIPP